MHQNSMSLIINHNHTCISDTYGRDLMIVRSSNNAGDFADLCGLHTLVNCILINSCIIQAS